MFINAFDETNIPIRLARWEVNRELSRARVGLCLSAIEGAMFASVEYLLAGLPIVTTPSKGGRHVYHDPEYCWTAAPDPRSVAEAVYALGTKGIPRDRIRKCTLRRLERDRERFLGLIDAILEEGGSRRRLERPWPFRKTVIMEWLTAAEAMDRAAFPRVDGLGTPERGLVPWRLRRKRWLSSGVWQADEAATPRLSGTKRTSRATMRSRKLPTLTSTGIPARSRRRLPG